MNEVLSPSGYNIFDHVLAQGCKLCGDKADGTAWNKAEHVLEAICQRCYEKRDLKATHIAYYM